MLESLRDSFPTILDELGGITRVDTLLHHLVEAQEGTSLQHAAQDGLLPHQVTLDLCDERAEQYAGAVTSCRRCVGLGYFQAITVWVILGVHRDERRYAKPALVLLTNLGSRTLRGNHHNGQIVADLHALLHNVETMTVGERCPLLHQRHHLFNDRRVLLVWCEVENQISLGYKLLVGADFEVVGGRIDEALAFELNSVLSEGIHHIATRVAHVQPLVQTLSTTTNDHEVLSLDLLDAVFELILAHETAATKLVQFVFEAEAVEVVATRRSLTEAGCIHDVLWAVPYGVWQTMPDLL
mmetsp:Transcript_5982/g.14243  ORF Transcript_5982/g.14243 Transcript_5982/m.14243 type:complete len:297 (-) Transcript_5982:3-893(-)